jgi:hypothetical protein
MPAGGVGKRAQVKWFSAHDTCKHSAVFCAGAGAASVTQAAPQAQQFRFATTVDAPAAAPNASLTCLSNPCEQYKFSLGNTYPVQRCKASATKD